MPVTVIAIKDAAGANQNMAVFDVLGTGLLLQAVNRVADVVPGVAATNLGKAEDAVFASGDTGVLMLGVRKDTAVSLAGTDGDYTAPIFDANGRLHVVLSAATNQPVNLAQIQGNAFSLGNGAASTTGTLRVTIADNSSGILAGVTTVTTVTNITNWGNVVDNAAFTDGTTRLSMSGYIFDETAGTALTENDAAAARINANRAQVFTLEDSATRGQRQAVDASGNASVVDQPTAVGGLTLSKLVSAATTNATSLKASAGKVYAIYCSNVNAAIRYLKLYNKASAPTVGTDVPVWTLGIPGNAAGAGFALNIDKGLGFATGIAYALTVEATDAGSTGVAINEIVVNIGYK